MSEKTTQHTTSEAEKKVANQAATPDTLEQDIADAEKALSDVPTDAHRFMRWGLIILLLGFGGFVTWGLTAKLDEGVPAPGTAIVQGERKVISHPTGGTVKAILVQEAQHVTKDQSLIELDDTKIRSEYLNTRQEYAAQLAKLTRLQAEKQQLDTIQFPETLAALTDSGAEAQMRLQRQLFKARRQALQNELKILDEQARANEENAAAKQRQLALVEEQIKNLQPLVEEGYAPRNQLLELQQRAEALRNEIEQSKRAAQDARLKAQQRYHEFTKEVDAELAETRKKVDMLTTKLQALKEELDHRILRSPVDGVVYNLSVHTIGGVVKPAQPIMEIIPKGEKVIFKAQVSPQYIDRIQAGQSADIQIGAFVNKPQLIIKGKVLAVSPDLIQPQDGRTPPYYEALIDITPEGRKTLAEMNAHIQPGMPATILIRTGERTLLDYLLRPLLQRLHTAMKEA